MEEFEAGQIVIGLPTFTEEELAKHNRDAERIWISYKNGVYDITDFIESHPGGEKILMAAGASAEPFWSIYTVHHNPEVFQMLEQHRIGNLKKEAQKSSESNPNDPYRNEPSRHKLLKVLTQKPFNAETPKVFSVDNIITPNELHFKRNHLPVPEVDLNTFELEILNDVTGKKLKFKLDDLKQKFKTYKIPVTIQCSGNRRLGMNGHYPVQGLMWDVNAISTAEWTGIKLKDLIVHCGIDLTDSSIKHVQFQGLDKDPSGSPYGASIPKEKVINEMGDVLIAFKMNDEDIPMDHGFPLRAVVPGIIGARSVKWLSRIIVSKEENKSHWQKNDYKLLPPTVKDLKEADFSKLKAVQESPIQSAICEPVDGAIVKKDNQRFTVKGYAFSGGGNSIESVLVSMDGGKSWKKAQVNQLSAPLYRQWAWALWEIDFDIPKDQEKCELLCVATDSTQNTQPETVKSIWNARGLMNNSWHKINVQFK